GGKPGLDELVESLRGWAEENGAEKRTSPWNAPAFSRTVNATLVPVGGDHLKPPADTSALIKKARLHLGAVQIESIMLGEYLELVKNAVKKDGVPVRLTEGDLRDNKSAFNHAAAYMLQGVLSSRLYLKRANRLAEHRVTKVCEPLYSFASLLGLCRYPGSE